jgi:hypothetical protein
MAAEARKAQTDRDVASITEARAARQPMPPRQINLGRLLSAALDFWGKRVEAIIANKRDTKVLLFKAR